MDADLLAEIAANPADDAPRLVYADLLAGRGDPRGELIHLQIKQMRTGYSAEIEQRTTLLLRAHEMRWREEAGIVGALTNFFRGFPSSLIGNAESILASRAALRTQPITSLSILSRLARVEELLALPELARITQLTITGEMGSYGRHAPLTASQVEALARAPLANLRELTLQEGALDDACAPILATAPWLPAIETLVVAKGELNSAAFATLAPHLGAIRHLAIAETSLDEHATRILAASPMRPGFIYLARGRLGDRDAAAALLASPFLANVWHLDLERTYVGSAAVIALAASPHVTKLRELNLAGGSIEPDGARALATSTSLTALVTLDLRDNLLTHAGVAALADGLAAGGLPALRRLGVTKNILGTGRFETYETDEYTGGSYEIEESAEDIAPRFAHRPGLVIE